MAIKNNKIILVTGATGYVGGRLVNSLLLDNMTVKVFVRDKNKAKSHSWSKEVTIATGNALNYQETLKALTGVHTAFYLLHSINLGANFDKIEAKMARNFAKAALAAEVKQIVYLGGINNDTKTSTHLKSRAYTSRSKGGLNCNLVFAIRCSSNSKLKPGFSRENHFCI